jgi:hypothetical protein
MSNSASSPVLKLARMTHAASSRKKFLLMIAILMKAENQKTSPLSRCLPWSLVT